VLESALAPAEETLPQAEASQTYVAMAGDDVAGFYTLVAASVEYNNAPARLAKGLARHPIPLMLLARLAIAKGWQGSGLGAGLLKDAMLPAGLNSPGTSP
jgi:predicted N-acetyltransferase YhbS